VLKLVDERCIRGPVPQDSTTEEVIAKVAEHVFDILASFKTETGDTVQYTRSFGARHLPGKVVQYENQCTVEICRWIWFGRRWMRCVGRPILPSMRKPVYAKPAQVWIPRRRQAGVSRVLETLGGERGGVGG
jgi:hypothetical protein